MIHSQIIMRKTTIIHIGGISLLYVKITLVSKHRTKEQKIIAQLKRKLQEAEPALAAGVSFRAAKSFHSPSLTLPVSELKKDLVRTVVLMGGIMAAQLATWQYMERGGWNIVKKLIAF